MNTSKSHFIAGLVAAIAMVASIGARAELVTNGGFETGTFSGWTLFGNTSTYVGVDNQSPQSGTYGAYFGSPTASTGGIFESLATVAGQSYTVSFWLKNENDVTGAATPNSFGFNWNGGAAEMSLTNVAATAYHQYTLTLLATSATTDLRFTFGNDPAFWDLDNVSVNLAARVVPEPGTLALLGIGALVAGVRRRRRS